MKPHLRFRLRRGAPHHEVPTWHGRDLTGAEQRPFRDDVDRVFRTHRHPVWITHEYEPADAAAWSAAERACALDRTFRAVSQLDRPFSPALVGDLAAVRSVEAVGTMPLAMIPVSEATTARAAPSAWAGALIGLDEAHRVTTGDASVVVAVLDTGVDLDHEALRGRLLPGRDLVDIIDGASDFVGDAVGADDDADDPGVGHGTHVSGIIAGRNPHMPIGVAPDCRILPVRVLGALQRDGHLIGAGLVDNIDNGIKWAVDAGASVINMSLGIRRTGGGLPHARVIAYARRRGVDVVAAAGNDGTNERYYPGSLPGVNAVGAIDRDGTVAGFSTWGDQVDIVAPGVDIYSSLLGNTYGFASGTSQAAPVVAGAAALLRTAALRRGLSLTPAQVSEVLIRTADRPGREWRDPHYGHGVLNLPDALRLLDHQLDQPDHRRLVA